MPLPLIHLAKRREHRVAIVDAQGPCTYRGLLDRSAHMASALLNGAPSLEERRVAFLVPGSATYAAVQWGTWRAGGVAVPLCASHPRPELEYVIADSGAEILVAHPEYLPALRPIAVEHRLRLVSTEKALAAPAGLLPELEPAGRAMILYTSGTTNKPKGVVTTHRQIEAQIRSLVEAWDWTWRDHILHVLPLHHIHGIINVLSCALWSGARCTMVHGFRAEEVWTRLIDEHLTLFMAVPTIYVKLIAAWEAADPDRQRAMSGACRRLRLMVSGSAALPVPVLEKWREISGQTLLERYGMTEIGMALSNPLRGTRRPGHVGTPLPGVEVRLVDEEGRDVDPGAPGEIWVRGEAVFKEYWNRPEATREAFRDGWFRTGDVAVLEEGSYRILGRSSVDIIKTGGYKVSALEIEEVLMAHPMVGECAVVGIPDPEWGERVCAALVLRDGSLTLPALREWARERLASYKLPSRALLLDALPRNAMGKVTKPDVARMFESR